MRYAAWAGVGLLLVAVVAAGALKTTNRVGVNLARPLATIAVVAPGVTVCQPGERVPADTGRLRFAAAGGPGVVVQAGAARGRAAPGWHELVVPLAAVSGEAQVCVTNEGPQALTLAGETSGPELAAREGGGARLPGRFHITYLRAADESWLSAAPDVAARVAAVGGNAYLWAGLTLLVAVASVALVARR